MIELHERVSLGGRPQQIRVLAARAELPILLVLHGGPGFPNGRSFIVRHRALAEHFTLVTWDQRGAGASYFGAGRERLTIEGLTADAAELVELLRRRHAGSPVFVLGLSWGSELGIRLVQHHPDGIAGFVGSGQAVDGERGEQLSYAAALARVRQVADAGSRRWRVRRDHLILRLVGPPLRAQYRPRLLGLSEQRRILAAYAPPLPSLAPSGDAAVAASRDAPLRSPARVTLAERVGRPLGIVRSLSQLWPTATSYDFRVDARRLAVPVWFFQGRHDHTTPSSLVAGYARVLEAPSVTLSWFEGSGHSPLSDETELFHRRLIEALGADAVSARGGPSDDEASLRVDKNSNARNAEKEHRV